ncbi:MAG: sodium:solute symporter family protein [Eubacteriales bacterium]
MGLQLPDFIMLLIYMAAMLYMGYYFSKGTKNADDYQFGGKGFGTLILIATLAATAMGSSSALGQAGAAYTTGLSVITTMIVPWCIGWSILVFIAKKIRSTNSTSIPDLFMKRYGNLTGQVTSILTFLSGIAGCAIQITGMGLLISLIMGDAMNFTTAVYVATAITVLYTSIGGLKAVVYTDVLQVIILAIGICIVIPVIVTSEVVQTGMSWSQIQQTIGVDKFNWLGGISAVTIISTIIHYIFSASTNAAYYQRIIIAKDDKAATRSQLIGMLAYLILGSVIVFTAILANITTPELAQTETVLTNLVIANMPVIIRGLMMAAFFSAIMSSMDSFLIITAERLTINILDVPNKYDEKKQLLIARLTTVVIGVGAMLLALKFKNVLAIVQYTLSISAAGLFFPFMLTLYWKKITGSGVLSGVIGGGFMVLILGLFTLPFDVSIAANLFSLIITVTVSLLTQKQRKDELAPSGKL